MSNVNGDYRTCDICGFSEFVPGWMPKEQMVAWAYVRPWNRLTMNGTDRSDVCSQPCLVAWAERKDGAL